MRTYYNPNKHCTVFVCPQCGYTYHDYSDLTKHVQNKEQPFLVVSEQLVDVDLDRYRTIRIKHYACPSCGIIQIDSSLIHKE